MINPPENHFTLTRGIFLLLNRPHSRFSFPSLFCSRGQHLPHCHGNVHRKYPILSQNIHSTDKNAVQPFPRRVNREWSAAHTRHVDPVRPARGAHLEGRAAIGHCASSSISQRSTPMLAYMSARERVDGGKGLTMQLRRGGSFVVVVVVVVQCQWR